LTCDERHMNVFLSEPTHKHGEKRIYTENAPTIQSQYGTGGDNIPYVNNVRRLTEIECERLQGFPDDWTKYGNYKGIIKEIPKSHRYKMLGNAVTVNVAREVIKRLKIE
ncbi:MAG: DNA cytosine methyltransferase, partial [Chryseobacterium sp.]